MQCNAAMRTAPNFFPFHARENLTLPLINTIQLSISEMRPHLLQQQQQHLMTLEIAGDYIYMRVIVSGYVW
jgi:hypothetical protein